MPPAWQSSVSLSIGGREEEDEDVKEENEEADERWKNEVKQEDAS